VTYMGLLAEKLLELAEKYNDPVIKLSALLESIEALVEGENKYEVYENIKKDEKLYRVYSEILDEMFNYILSGNLDQEIVSKIQNDIRSYMGEKHGI